MAYRGVFQIFRDISTRSLHGQNSLTGPNFCRDVQSLNCQRLKCTVQRFGDSPTGIWIKTLCTKFNDHLNILVVHFARQCNAIAAQRIRRGAQIANLYSRLYDKHSLRTVVETHWRSQKKSLSLLLGAVLFAWDEKKITDDSINQVVEELTSLRAGEDSPLKEQLAKNLGSEWETVMNQEYLTAWRKPIPNSYLYEYKVYGTFSDIPARAFFNVQTDLEYRKQWDKLVIHLDVVDSEQESGSEVIRWVTHYPFPMYSREYIFIRKYKVDSEKKVMIFMSQSTDHPQCPVVDKHVRVHHYKSNMVIRPHSSFDENGFDYVVTYSDDPQAAIPSTAIKWMASTGVPDFVEKLHKAAQRLHESKQRDAETSDTPDEKLAM